MLFGGGAVYIHFKNIRHGALQASVPSVGIASEYRCQKVSKVTPMCLKFNSPLNTISSYTLPTYLFTMMYETIKVQPKKDSSSYK